jgi:hypothetical protein
MANKVIPTNMPHPMSAVGWDGTDFHILTIDAAGHLQVDNLSSALPTGAATAANQLTEIAALQLIDDLRAVLHSVNTDELQVNVEDSVLPTGAATAANQATEITDLETIMPYDRGMSTVVLSYAGTLAAHADTTRISYTVPAGHRALFEAFWGMVTVPTAGAQHLMTITVNGVNVIRLYVEDTETAARNRCINWSGGVWLTAGDVLLLQTYSSSTANRDFYAGITLSEFDA